MSVQIKNAGNTHLLLGAVVAASTGSTACAAATQDIAASSQVEQQLRVENQQLRLQLQAMQEQLALANKKPANNVKNPSTPPAENAPSPVLLTSGFDAREIKPAAAEKTLGSMSCGAHMNDYMGDMKMEPGSDLLNNPVWGGLDAFWNHPKGMWMANVKWTHNQSNGLIAGSSPVNTNQVGSLGGNYKYPYMMPGRSMTMDMLMFMPMYGVTDDLTLMGMINYTSMNMPMVMNMGGISGGNAPMATGGLGDTQIDAIYRIHKYATATLGLSMPTGSIDQKVSMMGNTYLAPYDMQNGAGTWILQPDMTFNWVSTDENWNVGGNVQGNISLNTQNSWSRGNGVVLGSWLQRSFGAASSWLRLRYSNFAQIRGADPDMASLDHMMPDYVTLNSGGQVMNLLLGGSWKYRSVSLGLEGGIPVYQDVNGLQMNGAYMINSGFQAMF